MSNSGYIEVPSLSEIMSEELAHKLQEEEEKGIGGSPSKKQNKKKFNSGKKTKLFSFSVQDADNYLDPDLKLALQLSAELNTSSNINIEGEDPDFEFAVKLQQELDAELTPEERGGENQPLGPKSLFSAGLSPQFHVRSSLDRNWENYGDIYEDEEEDEEEFEEFEEFSDSLPELNHMPVMAQMEDELLGGSHKSAKTRISRKEYLITKHEPLINNFRNAELLGETTFSGNMKDLQLSNSVYNSLKQKINKTKVAATRVRGNRLEGSTSEQVLDHRTRVMLLKLLNQDIVSEFHGVVSTGKEANVYHAISGAFEGLRPGVEYAVKIYKTTLNEFKNRSEYLEDDNRFKNKTKSQNQKFFKVWAEKEYKNLQKLQASGIPSPVPIMCKEHILIMSFLGKENPAPRLKDVDITPENVQALYVQALMLLYNMFHNSKLVHADFSEYNLIYFKSKLHVIDVSQSVELDHPKSLEWLRRDISATNDFFRKKKALLISNLECFNFVTSEHTNDPEEILYHKFQRLQNEPANLDLDSSFEQISLPVSLKAMGDQTDMSVFPVHKLKETAKQSLHPISSSDHSSSSTQKSPLVHQNSLTHKEHEDQSPKDPNDYNRNYNPSFNL